MELLLSAKRRKAILSPVAISEATAMCDSSQVSFSRFLLVSGGECFSRMADKVIVNRNLENQVDIFVTVSKSDKT